MSLRPDTRTILPAEVRQPGLFIPLPSSPEQLNAFGEVRHLLGQTGLHGFDVDPDNEGKVLPYDPESRGTLGLVSFQEAMDYFKPIGLKTARDYAAAWRPLRGTSARIARDQEKWVAYEPLGAQMEQLQTERQAAYQQLDDTYETEDHASRKTKSTEIEKIGKARRQLERQIRKIRGSSQSLPSDPMEKPFIFVSSDWDEPRPLSRLENKVDDPTYVPDESTSLHLDNLHSNASTVFQTLRVSPDARINILLAQLLNDRITQSLQPES